jgi:transcription initiation factor TFIID TATA-box-binding protein
VVEIAKQPTYEIQNVVASVTLNQRLDLEKIAERIPHAEYSPELPGSPDPGAESSPGSS